MEEQPSFANNKAAAEFCIRSKDICKCAHIYDFFDIFPGIWLKL